MLTNTFIQQSQDSYFSQNAIVHPNSSKNKLSRLEATYN